VGARGIQPLIVAVATLGVALCLLSREPTFLGWLGVCHVGAKNAKHSATVDGALEATQSAIDRLVVADLDTYWHGEISKMIEFCRA
jgi:hypothetical protein